MTARSPIPAYYRSPEWQALRRQTLERDQEICAYCGEKAVTADHIRSRATGGMDDLENLVAVCLICNTIAGGKYFRDKEAKSVWVSRQRKKLTKRYKGKPHFDRGHYEETMRLLRKKLA